MIAPSTATVGIARTPHALPSSHICCGGQRRSITSQPHEATASFTNRNVSSQMEQPAVKTSIFLFSAISLHLLFCYPRLHAGAATLIDFLLRQLAEQLSVLLLFATTRI